MPDYLTYREAAASHNVAVRVQSVARNIAARLPAASSGEALVGWRLWRKDNYHDGEAQPKQNRTSFSWWQSYAELWLSSDGRVIFVERPLPRDDGMQLYRSSAINYSSGDGPRDASDIELFYPDAFKWRTEKHVERAQARDIIERHSVPELFSRNLGRGIRRALNELERNPRPPESVVPLSPPPVPAPQHQAPIAASGGCAPAIAMFLFILITIGWASQKRHTSGDAESSLAVVYVVYGLAPSRRRHATTRR